jgi:alpha-D-ribose 1-methylphosphonate 5-triphosphate synthase subunit PhnG
LRESILVENFHQSAAFARTPLQRWRRHWACSLARASRQQIRDQAAERTPVPGMDALQAPEHGIVK